MTSPTPKSALVVSAHSADFVWRAGGAIALHVEQGYQVHIVCLSYGERGESAKLWRKGQMTETSVKEQRQEEAQAAANILGASIEYFDLGDYLLRDESQQFYLHHGDGTEFARDSICQQYFGCSSRLGCLGIGHDCTRHFTLTYRTCGWLLA